ADVHGLDRHARQPAQERYALDHAGDGHDVRRLGGELGGRDSDHRVGGELTVPAERRPVPADALAGWADGLRRHGERSAGRAALDDQATSPHAVEELARGHAAHGVDGRGRLAHRGSRPNRLTNTVAVFPPRVWASPTVAPSTWRGPASPRSWVAISATCAAP